MKNTYRSFAATLRPSPLIRFVLRKSTLIALIESSHPHDVVCVCAHHLSNCHRIVSLLASHLISSFMVFMVYRKFDYVCAMPAPHSSRSAHIFGFTNLLKQKIPLCDSSSRIFHSSLITASRISLVKLHDAMKHSFIRSFRRAAATSNVLRWPFDPRIIHPWARIFLNPIHNDDNVLRHLHLYQRLSHHILVYLMNDSRRVLVLPSSGPHALRFLNYVYSI